MQKYFKENGITFEIDCYESYDKTKAIEKAVGLTNDELDTTFIEGKLRVRDVTLLQDKYKKKALNIRRGVFVRMYKYIKEIENTCCHQSLTDYYS